MPAAPSQFDASSSALGYLHQVRLGLLLALERDDDLSLSISLEKLDDVTFHKGGTPVKILQSKHHVSHAANLSDGSRDIWKTIRVWSELIFDGKVDPTCAVLCLTTTTEASDTDAIRLFRPKRTAAEIKSGRAKLEEAAGRSKDATIKTALAALHKLSSTQQDALFSAVHLLDGGLTATAVQVELERQLRRVADRQHVTYAVDMLQGWWFRWAVEHLSAASPPPLPLSDLSLRIDGISSVLKYSTESQPFV